MNNTVYLDPQLDDAARREMLYEGQLIVYSPRPSSLAFCAFARELIAQAFAPHDPRTAQHEMPVERYAEVLGLLKPAFIHHPESKRHLQTLLEDFGCNTLETYFDLPKMRSSTSNGYLTTGIAYAWHPHRDTWYSAPTCQLNWWIPIMDITADNAMAFHPRYFAEGVSNSSAGYNYYEWNQTHRGNHVPQYTKVDPRPLPKPTQAIELDPQIRFVVPVGGVILFSGAQLHSSVPNTSGVTRFSVDFRTVNLSDLRARRGAKNVDSQCTGTTLRDYLSASDLTGVPEDVVEAYDDGTAARGRLRFELGSTADQ
jgi:Phytanoyl-CoA dioxygenase (PhyH)